MICNKVAELYNKLPHCKKFDVMNTYLKHLDCGHQKYITKYNIYGVTNNEIVERYARLYTYKELKNAQRL